MKFEIFKSSKNQQVYFRLKSNNGRVVLESEGYKSREGANKAIAAIKRAWDAPVKVVEK